MEAKLLDDVFRIWFCEIAVSGVRRPVKEILIGWHVERGFMWPHVLLTYLLSPLVVGILFAPGTR